MVSSRCISSLPLWYYFLFLRPQGPSNLNILRSHFPRIFPAGRYVSAEEPLSPCTEILHYVQDDRWEAGKPLRAANAALLRNLRALWARPPPFSAWQHRRHKGKSRNVLAHPLKGNAT